MHGLLHASMNKVKVRGRVKNLFKLKLCGEVIATNSLVVKTLVYNTRDDGSNPSW